MISISNFVADFISGLVAGSATLLIIGLIIALIVRLAKGGESADNDVKNAGTLNTLLYVGSFLLVGSMILFIQDQPAAMPVVLITSSLLSLTIGAIIYRTVKYLRPVGIAFAYTGLALLPFWYYAFLHFGCSVEVSLFITAAVSAFGFFIGSIAVRSYVAGWICFLFLTSLGALFPVNNAITVYLAYLWPIFIAFFPLLCWTRRVKWLPVGLRQASRYVGYIIVPLVAFSWLPLTMIPDFGANYPLLRTLVAFLAMIFYLVAWLSERNRGELVAARIAMQFCLVSIIADLTNYSLVSLSVDTASGSVAMAVVWLVASLIQALISLIVSPKDESAKSSEKAMLAVSMISIALTPIFCRGLDHAGYGLVFLAMSGVIAILGIVAAIRQKNLAWVFATLFALLFVPVELNAICSNELWNEWVYLAIYAGFSSLVLAIYAAFLRKIQPKQSFGIALTAILASAGLAIIMSIWPEGAKWGCAPLAIAAAQVAILGIASDRKECYDISIITTAVSAMWFIDSLDRITGGNSQILGHPVYLADALRGLIIGGAILALGFWREKGVKTGPRLIIGTILLSAEMFAAAENAASANSYICSVLLIFAEAVLLIFGAVTDRKWMLITSACIIAYTVLFLTGGPNYIQLAILGIGMIGIVAWQLIKNNRKKIQ